MPIGLVREGGRLLIDRGVDTGPPTWAERVRAVAQTVISNVSTAEPVRRDLAPTFWTRWQTAGDERVCPVCGPYTGRSWPAGEGPNPPLHPNCRCQRTYAFTTWSVR